MKNFAILISFLFSFGSVFFANHSHADSGRVAIAGEDPNEQKSIRDTEADVAATGICRECINNLVHKRMNDNTTSRVGLKNNVSPTGGFNGSSGDSDQHGSTR